MLSAFVGGRCSRRQCLGWQFLQEGGPRRRHRSVIETDKANAAQAGLHALDVLAHQLGHHPYLDTKDKLISFSLGFDLLGRKLRLGRDEADRGGNGHVKDIKFDPCVAAASTSPGSASRYRTRPVTGETSCPSAICDSISVATALAASTPNSEDLRLAFDDASLDQATSRSVSRMS